MRVIFGRSSPVDGNTAGLFLSESVVLVKIVPVESAASTTSGGYKTALKLCNTWPWGGHEQLPDYDNHQSMAFCHSPMSPMGTIWCEVHSTGKLRAVRSRLHAKLGEISGSCVGALATTGIALWVTYQGQARPVRLGIQHRRNLIGPLIYLVGGNSIWP